jgi:hypothetical protein
MKTLTQAAALGGALFLLSAGPAFAQQADVVYLEGYPELKESSGGRFELDFGDLVRPGDSVVTGRTDYVELEQGTGNTIRVAADTVFTMQEVEEDGETQTVLSTAVGSVAFRFDRITGREPRLATPATVAGIRGTELTVYAGSDGSALFLVDSGLVDVEAAGSMVSLTDGEGVEVPAGGPPGEKFSRVGRELDFSTWNQDRLDAFMSDPVEGMSRLRERLGYFNQQIQQLQPEYQQYRVEFQRLQEEVERARADGNQQELDRLREEEFLPARERTLVTLVNLRYYALSALSLRRFVVSRVYTQVKARYLTDSDAPEYRGFLAEYSQALHEFEEFVVPQLVPTDL